MMKTETKPCQDDIQLKLTSADLKTAERNRTVIIEAGGSTNFVDSAIQRYKKIITELVAKRRDNT